MVRALVILVCVTMIGCRGAGGLTPKVLCDGHEIADGFGPSDDPGVGFTMDAAIATIDTIQTVDAVPAPEMSETTTTLDADIRVSFLSDIRHVGYEPPCGVHEGLEADVSVQVALGTWLHGEVETTLTALGDDFGWIWFGHTVEGQSFDTFELDPAAEAEILAYDPIGCGVPPTTVTGVLLANLSPDLLYLATDRCDREWHDYVVYSNTEETSATSSAARGFGSPTAGMRSRNRGQ